MIISYAINECGSYFAIRSHEEGDVIIKVDEFDIIVTNNNVELLLTFFQNV